MQDCQCQCGVVKFAIKARPVLRAICHCEICQDFNQKPFSDIAIFFTKDVDLPQANTVDYQKYRPPPAVQRGRCSACNAPAIELLQMPLMPALTLVPSVNVGDQTILPNPSLHIFYHRRVSDIDDDIVKYSGYWKSQFAFGKHFISSLIKQKKNA